MRLRKYLFLLIALALLSIPILQTVHALTHVDYSKVTTALNHGPNDSRQSDTVKACFDCAVLAALGFALVTLALFIHTNKSKQFPPDSNHRSESFNSSFPYLSRAPPIA